MRHVQMGNTDLLSLPVHFHTPLIPPTPRMYAKRDITQSRQDTDDASYGILESLFRSDGDVAFGVWKAYFLMKERISLAHVSYFFKTPKWFIRGCN